MSRTMLVAVLLEGQVLSHHAFQERGFIIGRHPDSDVVLDSPVISRAHVEVSFEDGSCFLNDLGSANGVLINGRKTQRCELRHGDVMAIGAFEIQVSLLEDKSPDRPTGSSPMGLDPTIRVPVKDSANRRED